MKYVCHTNCFHENRLWKVADILESELPVEQIPGHFKDEETPLPVETRADVAAAVGAKLDVDAPITTAGGIPANVGAVHGEGSSLLQ